MAMVEHYQLLLIFLILVAVVAVLAGVVNYNPWAVLINGSVIGVTAMLVYLWQKSLEAKKQRYKFSEMLLVELDAINKMLNPKNEERAAISPNIAYLDIPDIVYQGLVNSGNIANFSQEIQWSLYNFYSSKKRKQFGNMKNYFPEVYQMVSRFKKANDTRGLGAH